MYSDPANIRKHTTKIRLNDEEKALLLEVTAGGQEAVMARTLAIEAILNRFDPEGVNQLSTLSTNDRIKKVTKIIEDLTAERNEPTTN